MAQSGEKYVFDPSEYRDKSSDWYDYFNKKRRKEILEIINAHPDIIEEHRENPVGYRKHPSPYLQRVHNYFRMQPTFGKYYIYAEKEWNTYRIAEVREFGELPVLLDGEFGTEEKAMHGVFLQRIHDIRDELK